MPDTTCPTTVYWPLRPGRRRSMMKNCELRRIRIERARHADHAALERHVGKFRLQVGIFRTAGAVAVLAVAGLRHEAGDDAMERHVVVEPSRARCLIRSACCGARSVRSLMMTRPCVVSSRMRVLRIEPGRQLDLRQRGRGADKRERRRRECGSCRLLHDFPNRGLRIMAWRISSSAAPPRLPARRRKRRRPCRRSGAPMWR